MFKWVTKQHTLITVARETQLASDAHVLVKYDPCSDHRIPGQIIEDLVSTQLTLQLRSCIHLTIVTGSAQKSTSSYGEFSKHVGSFVGETNTYLRTLTSRLLQSELLYIHARTITRTSYTHHT